MKATYSALVFITATLAPAYSIAQEEDVIAEVERASQACRMDEVCGFRVLLEYADREELRSLMGGMLPYSILAGGIRAAILSEPIAAISYLNSAIKIVEGYDFEKLGYRGYEFYSSPLHLYRAEACREVGDWDCFDQSAAVLLELEVAMRKEALSEYPSYALDEGSDFFIGRDLIDRPINYQWSNDLTETAEHDPKGTDFDARINQVLIEAKRRLQ